MQKTTIFLLVLVLSILSSQVRSSESSKTLAATIDVYAFPKKGQAATLQSQDEAACYGWAANNTGNDPFDLQKQVVDDNKAGETAKQNADAVGRGAGAGGAIRGAAIGVLIDDSHDGAKKGAAVGVVASRMKARKARRQAKEAAKKQTESKQAATQEQITNFKKAFSVCLEAKDYLVKY